MGVLSLHAMTGNTLALPYLHLRRKPPSNCTSLALVERHGTYPPYH